MKKNIIILSFFLTFSCSTQTSKDEKADSNLFEFKDFNNITSFYKSNDTLFCITTNGTLFYNQDKDEWFIKDTINKTDIKAIPELAYSSHFPNGYKFSVYSSCQIQHGSWCLTVHAGEGAVYYKQEIVDTIKKEIFRFPYEKINDFFVDSSSIWIGSEFGLSRIDTKNFERTDYLNLPVFKKITSINETEKETYYLDFHYGLFKYEKESKSITPINEINKYVFESNYKFFSSYLINNQLIIIGSPMDKCGYYLKGKACLFIYNLDNNNVNKIETSLEYFDDFIKKDNFLIGFGEWLEYYEGGDFSSFGGAIAFDYETHQITEITNTPIINLSASNDGLEAINIQGEEITAQLIYSRLKLFEGYSFPVRNKSLQSDTIYLSYNGDSIRYIENKRVVVNNKLFGEYLSLHKTLNNNRYNKNDSLLVNLMFRQSLLKINRGKVE